MDLEQKSIERIKMASEMSLLHYGKPIVCTYSGGKDSDLMIELFIRSGVTFEVHHNHTTVDAPQTIYHLREKFKRLEAKGIKCTIEYPALSMWRLIPKKKFPPTRMARYCCEILKERGCKNRMIATGVRWSESTARASRGEFEILGKKKQDRVAISDEEMLGISNEPKFKQLTIPGIDTGEVILMNDNTKKRRFIERCELKAKTVCNPIIEWTDAEVWEYIQAERIEINPLYEAGWPRVGCIGCPMASPKVRYFEFSMFPKYEEAYIRTFDRMLIAMQNDGTGRSPRWKNGKEVFSWWMEEKEIEGQLNLFDTEDREEAEQ